MSAEAPAPVAPAPPPLSADARKQIDREVAKYPKGKAASAVMSALRIAQKEIGWLPKHAIEEVAAYLGIPAIRAYEVASFYNMYDLAPVGRNKLCLCTNLPCALMGAMKTRDALEEALGIKFGETSEDGEWTLKEGECFGACVDAPVVIVNNESMRAKITPDKVGEFVESLKSRK